MEEEEPEEEGSENGEETKAESSEKYDGEEEAEEIPDKEKSEKAENDQVKYEWNTLSPLKSERKRDSDSELMSNVGFNAGFLRYRANS